MSFNDLIEKTNTAALARFANCAVTVKLAGVPVRESFTGIFDLDSQVVSPFEGERRLGKPSVAVLDSDYAGITGQHVLGVVMTGATTGTDYAQDGKPLTDGSGMTIIFLAVKK